MRLMGSLLQRLIIGTQKLRFITLYSLLLVTSYNALAGDLYSPSIGEAPPLLTAGSSGYLARIALNSPEDVLAALERAEELFGDKHANQQASPLAFVLHGPEVAIFFKDNYQEHKAIADLAARLSALEVIDLKVCRTRMGVLGREPSELLPFVETVPFGPAEIERLLNKEKFVYF